jgi:dnd system-associated protein 4
MVDLLTEKRHPVSGTTIFPTKRELMCFAATLGFESGKRVKLDGKTNDVDGRPFSDHGNTIDLMCLLALAEEKDGEVLRDNREEDRLVIFEEYANGGFEVMQRWFYGRPDDVYKPKAILDGLLKDKFLEKKKSAEDAVTTVTF